MITNIKQLLDIYNVNSEEEFIDKKSDEVDWRCISRHQTFSKDPVDKKQ